jgi:hypothetical protein
MILNAHEEVEYIYEGQNQSRLCMWAFKYIWKPPLTNVLLPELVFLNPYGDQESMPRHQFRQPM